MEFYLILSSVLLVGGRAQLTADVTAQATLQLGPVLDQLGVKIQVIEALVSNVLGAVNQNTAAGLFDVVNTGLTSGLTSQFDALALITDSVADAPEAAICAVNASTAILSSISNGANKTVNCMLNKVLEVPNLRNQLTNVTQQLSINSLNNTLYRIAFCIANSVLTLDIKGCACNIITSVLIALTDLKTTIDAVLGQAINLVLSLISCAITALTTAIAIAGCALSAAVTCVFELAQKIVTIPPLIPEVPDIIGEIQSAINNILQLGPSLQEIQTLLPSVRNAVNALRDKISSLIAQGSQGIQNAMGNAVSSAMGIINRALTLNFLGLGFTCPKTAEQNANALIQNGAQAVLSCVSSIDNDSQDIYDEVANYAPQVLSNSVSAGIPAVAQCAVTTALSFSISAVTSCTASIVSQMTQFVTTTQNRLKALADQVPNLAAAVDQCMSNATAILLQKMQAEVTALKSCLGGFGILFPI